MIGQPVDDWHIGVLREIRNGAMRVRADHDRIDKTRQHARRIRHALAAAQLHIICARDDRGPAELAHALLKGEAGAGGGFLKNHRQRLAV